MTGAECSYTGPEYHVHGDPVDVYVSMAEYESNYDWEWSEADTGTGRSPYLAADRIYQVPHGMYDRWAAVRDGFWQVQEDITELKRTRQHEPRKSPGLPW